MEFLEAGGTLLVIVLMMWIGIQLAVRAERMCAQWKRGTTSNATTTYQWNQTEEKYRETYVDFAQLAREARSIPGSVRESAVTRSTVGT